MQGVFIMIPAKKNFILLITQQHPKFKRNIEYSTIIMPTDLSKQNISYNINDTLFGNGFLNADFSSYQNFKKSSLYRVFYQFTEDEFNSARSMLANLGNNITLDYLNWFKEFGNINFSLSTKYADISKQSENVVFDYSLGILPKEITTLPEEKQHSMREIYDMVSSEKYSLKEYEFYCSDLKELLCAELHFYLTNGYKFKICKHCGRLFPTKDDSFNYCNRNSPIEKYSHLKCVDAQQRIRKNSGANHPLKKRFNVLSSTLDRLINVQGEYDKQTKKDFLRTAKIIRETKTEEEYSQWLFEQELKYKTRTKKAYQNNKNEEDANNG